MQPPKYSLFALLFGVPQRDRSLRFLTRGFVAKNTIAMFHPALLDLEEFRVPLRQFLRRFWRSRCAAACKKRVHFVPRFLYRELRGPLRAAESVFGISHWSFRGRAAATSATAERILSPDQGTLQTYFAKYGVAVFTAFELS